MIDLEKTLLNAAFEQSAKVLDAEATKWRLSKSNLRSIEDGGSMPEAHDRHFNYIENAKRLAKEIRSLKVP